MSLLSETERVDFQSYIAGQLGAVPGFEEDTAEVAEYIALLVNNGRPIEETLEQLNELFGAYDLKAVVESCYKALSDYKQQQVTSSQSEQHSQQAQQQQQQQQHLPQELQEQQQQQQQPDLIIPDSETKALPTKPAAYARNGNGNGYGVSKNGSRGGSREGPKSFAFKNQNSLAQALNLSGVAGADTFINSRGQTKKKGRCPQFPHCPDGKECMYAHPTTVCFRFQEGQCQNAPGTCSYLHPGEDDALMAEWEKVRAEFQEKRKNKQMMHLQNTAGLTLCKFGTLCTNQQCPFGHPTPANEDAKVIILVWCPANLECTDAACSRAHSSLSRIKEVKPMKAAVQQEKSLAPCKFGPNCTNRFCKFRHAKTPVMCRDGENCTRIDCFFSHPLSEECRFGENCKNSKCHYQHPNGKAPPPAHLGASSLTWTKTNERQFAVPEDQILEKAPAQES